MNSSNLRRTKSPSLFRYIAWLTIFTLINIFYNWVSYSYMQTDDYDPFRFYRMVKEPLEQHNEFNRDVLVIYLLKATYLESISFIALPVLLALILVRIEKINQTGKFLFPLIASPSLPFLIQTGKDGIYLVLLITILVLISSRKIFKIENLFYFLILGITCLLVKGAATLFGLMTIYLIQSKHSGLLKPVLLSSIIGSTASLFFLELPDLDILLENSNIHSDWITSLTVTQQMGPTFLFQSIIRSIAYFLYNFLSPVIWLFKSISRQDFSLSIEIISSAIFLIRLFMLDYNRRLELMRQLIILSVLLGFSYFFLHFRYLSVLVGLLVVSESIIYYKSKNSRIIKMT